MAVVSLDLVLFHSLTWDTECIHGTPEAKIVWYRLWGADSKLPWDFGKEENALVKVIGKGYQEDQDFNCFWRIGVW